MVADLAVLAEEKSQQVVIEAHGSPRGLGDRLMLRQALDQSRRQRDQVRTRRDAAIVIRVVESTSHADRRRDRSRPRHSCRPRASTSSIGSFARSSAPADVAGTRTRSLDCEVCGRDAAEAS